MTDAAGKWKTHTMDALGNLVKVTEPLVGDTNYTYDALNHLTQVSMVRGGTTQLRTFVYDPTTQRLMSATNPETGTVTYAYNADGTLLSKTDAKGQRIQYGYDDKQRVTSINRYNGQTLNNCDSQTFTYDSGDAFSENVVGRLVKEEWGYGGCANGGAFVQTHSYTPAGLRTKKKLQVWRDSGEGWALQTVAGENEPSFFSYDNEGRVAAGEGRTYVYDTMGRLSEMKEGDGTVTASATYGAAGQMLTMSWKGVSETREYNSLLQLTRQRAVGMFNIVGLDVEYRYPAGTNNGRITSQKENVSGEEVSYQYDELNRLIAATTTGPQWGLSFGYDGFGNRTTQTVTKGTAPQVQLSYDGSNRVNSVGWSHDSNGNVTAMPLLNLDYDGYNRLSYSNHSSQGPAFYGYDPSNKRVWQTDVNGVDKFTYYNVLGQRTGNGNVYFAGRLIMTDGGSVVTDRLGSVRRRMNSNGYWGEQLNYFPYGEEQVVTASDKEKFGTYLRDQKTNLDYADQRYFASGFGRFVTPDPSQPGDPKNPQSWNYYGYTQNDPMNANDPKGLNLMWLVWEGGGGGLSDGFLSSILVGYNEAYPETPSRSYHTLGPGSVGPGAGGSGEAPAKPPCPPVPTLPQGNASVQIQKDIKTAHDFITRCSPEDPTSALPALLGFSQLSFHRMGNGIINPTRSARIRKTRESLVTSILGRCCSLSILLTISRRTRLELHKLLSAHSEVAVALGFRG